MTSSLSVRSLSFRYSDRIVLRDVTFDAAQAEFLAILGPNGAGKTTLLRCIDGILSPSSGNIVVDTLPLATISRAERARRLAYVPQRSSLVGITAFDAVLLGRRPYVRWNVAETDIRIADAVMRHLGIGHLALRPVEEMSGGELQMILLARALVQEPSVLLLDEPTGSLDPRHQIDVLGIVRHIVREHRITAVMTIHDINMALRFADRLVFLSPEAGIEGATLQYAVPPAAVTGEMIRGVYGFDAEVLEHGKVRIVVPVGPFSPDETAEMECGTDERRT